MKKIVDKKGLEKIISEMKTDLYFAIQNIEYREKVISILENSIKEKIKYYNNIDILDSHWIINDFKYIDSVYSISYTIYNDIEMVRDERGHMKKINYIPYAAYLSIGKYNDNYFYNNYSIDPKAWKVENNINIVRKNKCYTAA